jgi:hypothetical protein
MNPNMMQPPPLNGMNGMMSMQQQQPGPQQYINQQVRERVKKINIM